MEEKKKKAYRKRDRFWKLLFPHYKPREDKSKESHSSRVHRDSEQTNKITSLQNYAKHNFSMTLDPDLFESILESNNWDSKQSMMDLIDYEEASHGILVEPPRTPDKPLLGSENDGGTSCYIDALLFAMFMSNTAFDPLLTYDIPSTEEEDEKKIKLQTLMRLFVNKLRKGHFVKADYVHWFRKILQEANWNGQDHEGQWTQEDASELFMYITETFDLPYLPFQIRLFHGGTKDKDDDRVMTDRTVTLSIPDDDDDTLMEVKLQDILVDYFYNNIITGVMRQVDDNNNPLISENVAASPTYNKTFLPLTPSDEKYTLKKLLLEEENRNRNDTVEQQVPVTAWQVLELLPFYSATNEQGEAIETQVDSSFPDTHMILPIILKRYRYDVETGASTKIKKRVEIPITIDFNQFVNRSVDDPTCPICGHLVNWTLHFKSAVCHLGDSPYSGHYVSYARIMTGHNQRHKEEEEDEENFFWLKLDDMKTESRVTQIMNDKHTSAVNDIYEDLSQNAYILFYELDKTCHHPAAVLPPYYSSTEDEEESNYDDDDDDDDNRNIILKKDIHQVKIDDSSFSSEEVTRQEECEYCKDKKKKKKPMYYHRRRHQHQHNHYYQHFHDKSRLKESCKLM